MPNTDGSQQKIVVVQATSNLAPPEPLDFSNCDAYPKWRRRFERFATLTKMASTSDDEEQMNTCMYCMGKDAEDVYTQFTTKPKNLVELLDAFQKYFFPQINVIFERFKFNSRVQRQGEPIDDFITDLHSLAEKCNFQALKEELIRDRIVVGMLNVRVSEQLQLKPDLTLKIAKDTARQAESQSKQTKMIRDEKSINNVNRFKKEKGHQKLPNSTQSTKEAIGSAKTCMFCGKEPHDRSQCPARTAVCSGCKLRGHYQKVCKKSAASFPTKKKVNHVTKESANKSNKNFHHGLSNVNSNRISVQKYDPYFIGTTSSQKDDNSAWFVECFASELNVVIKFLVDTGADCICLPSHFEAVRNKKYIQENPRSYPEIKGADGKCLNVLGSMNLTLTYGGLSCKFITYIVENLQVPLLALNAIKQLKVLSPPKNCCFISENVRYENINQKFPSLFGQIGEFHGDVSIKLKPGSTPFVQSVPRNVAIPLLPKLENELKRLVDLNIIEPIHEVTEWVSPIVVVPKSSEEIRLCVDYTQLNKSVLRPYFPIEKVELKLARIKEANFFSKIDCNKGFYQIKLDEKSQLLTCFICPFGRYIFKRLPFGISCAPEYFVTKFSQVLNGIENVLYHIDDILIFGKCKKSHDETLLKVLNRLSQEGITINSEKSIFGVPEISYLGYQLSSKGISVDPQRIEAISKFPRPENKVEVQRFLGMINYVARFVDMRSSILEPLNALTGNTSFIWSSIQEKSFNEIKKLISEAPTLAFFDPTKQIVISSDASSYGIGACLIQMDPTTQDRQIVAYTSRTMTETEKRYFQIEREALALVWAADKFSDYITGIPIIFETDHKPLVQLLQSKPIDTLTLRIQRFRMRLMRYSYEIVYVPGKLLSVADALSRSPLPTSSDSQELTCEVEAYVNFITGTFPVKDQYLSKIQTSQENDPICQKLKIYCSNGWPTRNNIPDFMIPYHQHRNDINFADDLLLHGSRIIIPKELQNEILNFIHKGHQGLSKCRRRAQLSVWWIGLSSQLDSMIKDCNMCVEHRQNHREPFIREEFPTRPMEKVAADLFKNKVNKSWYVIITDYYSRFFEIYKLTTLTDNEVINKMKTYFATFGICSELRTDNGGQFDSYRFQQFTKDYNFVHNSNSPKFSQSNGAVEASVKVAKSLLEKNGDHYQEAVLCYRSTPLENGFCPSELMMGRKFKTQLPMLPKKLEVQNSQQVVNKENQQKSKQEQHYNKRHKTSELSTLKKGDKVWVTDIRQYGIIEEKLDHPRSYIVETPQNKYRRNRWHLIPVSTIPNQHRYGFVELAGGDIIERGDPVPTNSNNLSLDEDLGFDVEDNDNTLIPEEENLDSTVIEVSPEVTTQQQPEVSTPVRKSDRMKKPPGYLKDYIP